MLRGLAEAGVVLLSHGDGAAQVVDFSGMEFDNYKSAFELFQKALHAGSCEKIVLSRTLRVASQ